MKSGGQMELRNIEFSSHGEPASAQNVAEDSHWPRTIYGPLFRHHASPLTHRASVISSATDHVSKRFENLCRPDNRHMRRIAYPKDFFLHLASL